VNLLKSVWSWLFRLFPCPTELGLRALGQPGADSPVLVTCNFHGTVQRLRRALCGHDVWLLVAQSKGVNVWCAAGGDELNTDSVVSALKTSGLERKLEHRRLILPPLAAPGVSASELAERTGWKPRWGPVRAADLPRYLADGCQRSEPMKRVTYDWKERLDTGLGSLFPFYLFGALLFLAFRSAWLPHYLLAGAASFLAFMLLCPWLPGRAGFVKALALDLVLGAGWLANELLLGWSWLGTGLLFALVATMVWGSELGGLSSTLRSEFDPMAARMGIGAIGNTRFAGTLRTDLLIGKRALVCERSQCSGCRACHEICPLGLWRLDEERKPVQRDARACTACTACVKQCPSGALQAWPASPDSSDSVS